MAKKRRKTDVVVPPTTTQEALIPVYFESPESQSILSAYYDIGAMICTINFTTGKSYTYKIEPSLWVSFEQAVSKGGFFSARIRPFFPGRLKI